MVRIKDLPTGDLLRALSDLRVGAPCTVEMWLAAEGYAPGRTRMGARTLYVLYKSHTVHVSNLTAQVVTLKRFGQIMAGRFKKSRGASGIFYWIKRDMVCVEPHEKKGGPGEPARGGHPPSLPD